MSEYYSHSKLSKMQCSRYETFGVQGHLIPLRWERKAAYILHTHGGNT